MLDAFHRAVRDVVSLVCTGFVGPALLVLASACGGGGSDTPVDCGSGRTDCTIAFTLEVVDEAGAPIAGASVDPGDGRQFSTDSNGHVDIDKLPGPTVLLISGKGLLTEPVAVGLADCVAGAPPVRVRMLSDKGGTRWVMHAGGDTMFGRRYVEPTTGTPLLRAGSIAADARNVVANLASAFRAADLRTVNLETVVGDMPLCDSYPGKRFIIQSPPDSVAALEELGVDLVALGNNHSRDYLDPGVASTIATLDAQGIRHVGAVASGADTAARPEILTITSKGVRVAIFSFTTLTGSAVNDAFPSQNAPVPSSCQGPSQPSCQGDPPMTNECFQYDDRSWGFSGMCPSPIPVASRRIGEAWQAFDQSSCTSATDRALAWNSLYSVYPEMQEWVARPDVPAMPTGTIPGHGGAILWDTTTSKTAIMAARQQADLVVVQLHAGFQFQSAPSSFVRTVTRHAIDAGADIVIAHHPHVLQGAEWYKNKLIVYSLGNFIFDQDFLATFPSVFLRTVWEGSTLVEARFVLTELVGYLPTPVTDAAAVRTARTLWERSALATYSDRDSNGDIRVFAADAASPDTRLAHMRMRHHDAVIADSAPAMTSKTMDLAPGETEAIGQDGLVHAQAGGADVLIGRDLFGWGHFEDALADRLPGGAAQWSLGISGSANNPIAVHDQASAASGTTYVKLVRPDVPGETLIRPVARIPLPEHLLYRNDAGDAAPLDGDATYSIRLLARLKGAGRPYFRLELYHFDDTNPTEDPTTDPIGGGLELALDGLMANDRWQVIEVPIPTSALTEGGTRANVVLLYLRFAPPPRGEDTSELAVDDVTFIEWRPARQMSDHFGAYDFLHNPGMAKISATIDALPLRD